MRLGVMTMHQKLPFAPTTATRRPLPPPADNRRAQAPTITPPSALLGALAALHAHARLYSADGVDGDAVDFVVLAAALGVEGGGGGETEVGAVGVLAREVEQVDAGEDGEEAAEQGDGVDGVGGVEAAEEDEGGAEGAGGEGDVVEGVDSGNVLAGWVGGEESA